MAAEYRVNFPHPEVIALAPAPPRAALEVAHVVSLGPGYMEAYHDEVEYLPEERFLFGFTGDNHDVVLLGKADGKVFIHDPSPDLMEGGRDPLFDDLPVVSLDFGIFSQYYNQGDFAKEVTLVQQLIIKKDGKRQEGEALDGAQREITSYLEAPHAD